MKKQEYVIPTLDVISFDPCDIITTSDDYMDGDGWT